MTHPFIALISERVVLLDGGMGTELMRYGFTQGMCPETWNTDDHADDVRHIHKSYYDAGSDAVLTNSFGGSLIKLNAYGVADQCHALNKAAAELVQSVKPEGCFVGGDIGPTGQFLQPQGVYTEKDFEASFSEQVAGLLEGGVDFFIVETMYDLREALCACRAVKALTPLPLFAAMTYTKTPRGFFTLMGNTPEACIQAFTDLGVQGVGANCTLDSRDMADLVKIMREHTDLPLVAQANAGQPVLDTEGNVTYSQDLDDYVQYIPAVIRNGANIIGGCCGTDPAYIRKMAESLKD